MLKKTVLCVLTGFCASAFAVQWNSEDAKQIDASVNEKSVEQKFIAAGLKAMIGKNPGNISYTAFKKEWMEAVATRKEKSKYYEWYVGYAVPQAVYCIQRFRPFIKDVIADPQYEKSNWVNVRYVAEFPEFFDAAQWRIKALAVLSLNDYILSRKVFNSYQKMMKKYSQEEVEADWEIIKSAVDRNKAKDKNWEKFAADVDRVIQKSRTAR